MASDSREREAQERLARRIKDQNEREGKGSSYEKALSEARRTAIEHDRRRER